MKNKTMVDADIFYNRAILNRNLPIALVYMLPHQVIADIFHDLSEQLKDPKGHVALEATFLMVAYHAYDYAYGLYHDIGDNVLGNSFALGSDEQGNKYQLKLDFNLNTANQRYRIHSMSKSRLKGLVPWVAENLETIEEKDKGQLHKYHFAAELLLHQHYPDENIHDYPDQMIAQVIQHRLHRFFNFHAMAPYSFKMGQKDLLEAAEYVSTYGDTKEHREFSLHIRDALAVSLMAGSVTCDIQKIHPRAIKKSQLLM